jgi:hypothetical protein
LALSKSTFLDFSIHNFVETKLNLFDEINGSGRQLLCSNQKQNGIPGIGIKKLKEQKLVLLSEHA